MLISVPVWGRSYIASMGNFLIRTLLAPENLPAVAKRRPILVEFSTRASDAEILRTSRAVQDIGRFAQVGVVRYPDHLFQSHPQAPDFNYRLFGAMHHMSIFRAKAMGDMDVVMLCADHIFSDKALGQIDAYLEAGFKMVVSAGMRIDKDAWLPALLNDLNRAPVQDYLAFPPRQLVDYAVRFMHPVTKRLVVSSHTRPFGGLPFPLYFPNRDGFSAHSFVLHPVAVAAELVQREIPYDFNTVDGAFLTRILLGQDHETVVAILGSEEEAHLFEASEPDNLQNAQAVPCFSEERVAKYFFDWRVGDVEPVYRWFFRQGIPFRTETEDISRSSNDVDENSSVKAILDHIASWEYVRTDSAATS